METSNTNVSPFEFKSKGVTSTVTAPCESVRLKSGDGDLFSGVSVAKTGLEGAVGLPVEGMGSATALEAQADSSKTRDIANKLRNGNFFIKSPLDGWEL